MKIVIPFKKEVVFKDNLEELTSISLEHQLSIKDSMIEGKFLITGDYKVSSSSDTTLPFTLDLPVAIDIEDNYDTTGAECDIDDFYYEIINSQKLAISIDIGISKLEELNRIENEEITDNIMDEIDAMLEEKDDNPKQDNKIIDIKPIDNEPDTIESDIQDVLDIKEEENKKNSGDNINSLFNNLDNSDTYVTYRIYIVREGDTIETITEKYQIDIDSISEYNDITDLKIGDKIIIPNPCVK